MRGKTLQTGMLTGELALYNVISGTPNKKTVDYINRGLEIASTGLAGINNALTSGLQSLSAFSKDTTLWNKAKGLINATNIAFNHNSIIELNYDNYNVTNEIMKRYICSNPLVSNMLKDDLLSGFDGNYFKVEAYPEKVTDSYDYMRVTDGTMIPSKYEEDELVNITHMDSLTDVIYENDLTLDEQMNLLNTYSNVENLIDNSIDPTTLKLEEF